MAKKTAKKPAKPATAKGKVVKPVKMWAAVEEGRIFDVNIDRRCIWMGTGIRHIRVTVTPAGGRGKRGK